MPNTFAYIALLIWPLITYIFFRKKEIRKAILLSMLGSFFFLPSAVEIDLPVLPELNKYSISTIAIFYCCMIVKKQKIAFFNLKGLAGVFWIALLISPLLTVLANSAPIGFRPGLKLYDSIGALFLNIVSVAPFFLGRKFFAEEKDRIFLFKFLVLAALVYSVLILLEIRISPQLHSWFYGFFPHSFLQQSRGGGFRAVVFMGHGLLVAFFIAISVIAATTLWKLKVKVINYKTGWVLLYLLVVLVLSKTLSAMLYAFGIVVLLVYLSPKLQLRIVLVVAIVTMSYPILSIEKLFPHDDVIEQISAHNPERAESLQYRFINENQLLNHALKQPLFGWGGWGRNRIYDETGKNISTTDGGWITVFGTYGWLGMVSLYGLIFVTLLGASRSLKFTTSFQEQFLLSSHALLVSVIFVDQVPNSSLNPFYWLLVGSLYAQIESVKYRGKLKKISVKEISSSHDY